MPWILYVFYDKFTRDMMLELNHIMYDLLDYVNCTQTYLPINYYLSNYCACADLENDLLIGSVFKKPKSAWKYNRTYLGVLLEVLSVEQSQCALLCPLGCCSDFLMEVSVILNQISTHWKRAWESQPLPNLTQCDHWGLPANQRIFCTSRKH